MKRRRLVLLLPALPCALAAAQAPGEPTMTKPKLLTDAELAALQRVVLAHLQDKRPLNWEMHAAELQRGAPMTLGNEQRIGRWLVSVADDHKVLVLRDADVAPDVRRYGLEMRRGDGGFSVTADFWEREQFR